jgi:hypothetical protein
MNLTERIARDLSVAMKAREAARVAALRLVKAALKNREIEKGGALTDTEAIQVLKTLAKQRAEAMAHFETGGRRDLVEKEAQEKLLIESYLPASVSSSEVESMVGEVLAALGASNPMDIGRVMKEVLSRLQATGKLVDGKSVSDLVRSRLSNS